MSEEVPPFRSCCFCFPLRAGLLIWGYFKMIADVLILLPLMYFEFLFLIATVWLFDIEFFVYTVVTLITIIAIVANFVATFVFVIGCHQKNVKRIRGFYVYSLWELKLMTALIVVAVGMAIIYQRADVVSVHFMIFTIYLLILALHAYFILLLRSEVIKLNACFEISFVNNSAEVEHVMPCKYMGAPIEHV